MSFAELERLSRLRWRLANALGIDPPPPAFASATTRRSSRAGALATAPGPVDLFVTACEVSERQGTGVLLGRLFSDDREIVSVRSADLYGGVQRFGAVRVKLAHGCVGWREVLANVLRDLGALDVRRILCVPFGVDEVHTALAARDVFGAPLCTWVMDDQNVEVDGIPDALLRRLFARSQLLLAISPELRRAYEAKFGRRFALAPPAVSPAFVQIRPGSPDPDRVAARRGVLFGNIWGARWLAELLRAVEGAGVVLDWHSGAGTPWMPLDRARLAAAGITVGPHLPEPDLVATLRASPFVVVPSGTLEGEDSHRSLARLSLPSRMPYVAATAGTPIVVLGHPETAAARFVARHGLGLTIPYDRRALADAVDALCRPEAQARHRAAAAALAPVLSAEGMKDWIWRSLASGAPADDRFRRLEQTS